MLNKEDKAQNLFECPSLQQDISTVYQPIYSLAKGDITLYGHEAFVRHKQGYKPQRLFRMAIQKSKAQELDLTCIDKAVTGAPEEGLVFINIRPSTLLSLFEDERLFKWFTKKVPAGRSVLEIVEIENVTHKMGLLRDCLRALRNMGYFYAIDDIASGFNRLHLVTITEPHFIKIDGPMVEGCHNNVAKQSMIKHLVAIGDEIGSKVVAENIETREELETIQKLNVGYAQGFYLGKPQKIFQTTNQREVF